MAERQMPAGRSDVAAIWVAALVGVVSSTAGYWVGPVLSCGDVTTESAHYCGIGWWLIYSNAVVIVGGGAGGLLLGLSRRIWIAAMIGILVGNLVGPLIGVEIALRTPYQAALFGSSPKAGLGAALGVGITLFTVLGGVLGTVGWALGARARSGVISLVQLTRQDQPLVTQGAMSADWPRQMARVDWGMARTWILGFLATLFVWFDVSLVLNLLLPEPAASFGWSQLGWAFAIGFFVTGRLAYAQGFRDWAIGAAIWLALAIVLWIVLFFGFWWAFSSACGSGAGC